MLSDAAADGDIPAERLTPTVLEVLHALLIERALLNTRELTREDITEMDDEVVLPLVVP